MIYDLGLNPQNLASQGIASTQVTIEFFRAFVLVPKHLTFWSQF